MPNRIIREGFLTSDKVDRLSWVEECFYHRLLLAVDDYGRYHADPPLLIGKIMPRKIGNVSNQDIEKWLTACVTAGLVRVYGVDGKRYLEVLQFDQRTRAKKSKFPAPDEEKLTLVSQMTVMCQTYASHVTVIRSPIRRRIRIRIRNRRRRRRRRRRKLRLTARLISPHPLDLLPWFPCRNPSRKWRNTCGNVLSIPSTRKH